MEDKRREPYGRLGREGRKGQNNERQGNEKRPTVVGRPKGAMA